MDKKIRVAHIIGIAANGGVESVIMNYYRNVDRTKVQFDFLAESESKIINKEEIEKMGGRVIIIPSYKKIFKYNKELKRIFKENQYDIVHSNMNTLSVFPLRVAKKCGIKVRIAHSHSTSNKKEFVRNLLKNILRKFSKVYATHYFSCGELAGRYQFGNKTYDKGEVTIIRNAIDVKKFAYNEALRNKVRKELNVEEKFVIGHVGRFVTVKNHTFLIDVFNEVAKEKQDAVLLLVGDGPLKNAIEDKVESMGLKDKVIFYGSTSEVAPLYNAMDVFVLPSLYEGFPVVCVEAQTSGLKCLFSDKVSKECKILDSFVYMSLDDNIDCWKSQIISSENREKGWEVVETAGFSISNEAAKLNKLYEKILSEGSKK